MTREEKILKEWGERNGHKNIMDTIPPEVLWRIRDVISKGMKESASRECRSAFMFGITLGTIGVLAVSYFFG